MTSIYDIVSSINVSLIKLFEACSLVGGQVNGIAETTVRDEAILPELNGEHVGIDDIYPARVYHKLSTLVSAIKPNTGYGREQLGEQVNTYTLGLIVFLNRARTQLYPDELLLYMQANFPRLVKLRPFNSVTIKFIGATLDSRLVYATEYGNTVQYRLQPNQYLFRVNYTVEAVFDPRCYEKCP